MTYNEFRKWLKKQGCTFTQQGKGSHGTVEYRGKRTTLPNHGSKEIGEGLRKKIMKDLGLR